MDPSQREYYTLKQASLMAKRYRKAASRASLRARAFVASDLARYAELKERQRRLLEAAEKIEVCIEENLLKSAAFWTSAKVGTQIN